MDELKIKISKSRFIEGVNRSIIDPHHTYESALHLSALEVGNSGERYYNEYLHKILNPKVSTIEWTNESGEAGHPYDFKISIGPESFYVDVKATKGPFANKIYMSGNEIRFATANKDNYLVARLFEGETDKGLLRAGNFNVKILNYGAITSRDEIFQRLYPIFGKNL